MNVVWLVVAFVQKMDQNVHLIIVSSQRLMQKLILNLSYFFAIQLLREQAMRKFINNI